MRDSEKDFIIISFRLHSGQVFNDENVQGRLN